MQHPDITYIELNGDYPRYHTYPDICVMCGDPCTYEYLNEAGDPVCKYCFDAEEASHESI